MPTASASALLPLAASKKALMMILRPCGHYLCHGSRLENATASEHVHRNANVYSHL